MKHKNIYLLLFFTIFITCKKPDNNISLDGNSYEQEMRYLVQELSIYAKELKNDFIIIPQNGESLVKIENTNDLSTNYLTAIDGMAAENVNYGFLGYNKVNSKNEREYKNSILKILTDKGKPVLALDYCDQPEYINDSKNKCGEKGFLSFTSSSYQNDNFPGAEFGLNRENNNEIKKISDAQNFVCLLNNKSFSKNNFIIKVQSLNHDLLVIDPFIEEKLFTNEEINQLKFKKNKAKRLVFAAINLSRVDLNYSNWHNAWKQSKPNFINKEISNYNIYRINFWDLTWQKTIFGDKNSKLAQIISLGYDGVYLTGVEDYELYK